MKLLIDGTDLTLKVRYDELQPSDTDLGQQIQTSTFTVRDPDKTIAKQPREGYDVKLYDDDNVTLIFRGRIAQVSNVPAEPIGRAWVCSCQSYAVRASETQTGSLDRSAIVSSDRDHIIAIWRSALSGITSSPNGATVIDAVVTANEPNWTGVGATAFTAGLDFSYMTAKNAMDNLSKYVPNAYWRLDPDLTLRYGLFRDLAPFSVTTSPSGALLKGMEGYTEETYIGNHRNKLRRGGAGASTATAYDEASIARLGAVLEDPYKNDTTVPASDLTRRAYAELKSYRIRRVVKFTVRDAGLAAGQVIDIVNSRIGPGTLPSPFVDTFSPIFGRSLTGQLAGERGHLLIQKVSRQPLGNRQYAWNVEAGDNVRDFETAVAVLAGAGH